MMTDQLFKRYFLPLLLLAQVTGCTPTNASTAPPAAVEVLTTTVAPEPVIVTEELPGRVVASQIAEIRPQVSGIVQARLFEQGAMVQPGQPLFRINEAPYRADADTARATLAKATAAYARAKTKAERLQSLVEAEAISQQSYDDAVAAQDQAAAEVEEARATLQRRELDVDFSHVVAPIAGRIGEANVTQGALVNTGDTNPLATIQQIDRVYIDIRQPAGRYGDLHTSEQAEGAVEIITPAGQIYPLEGRILFSGTAVDPGTGDVLVRVEVDNPEEQLLPGMYVRARLPQQFFPTALTVPQQAVTRDSEGHAQVSIVDQQDRVRVQNVTVGPIVKGRYVILSGIKQGDRVIVEGQDRVLPNATVASLPWRKT